MIARTWRGCAATSHAHRYVDHFKNRVIPNLKRIAGHQGALLLRREIGDEIEFVAFTLWDTLDTIRAFAGDDPNIAHIEPEGQSALTEFDQFARIFEIVIDTTKDA